MGLSRGDEFAAAQGAERRLDRTPGKAGGSRNVAKTRAHRTPAAPRRAAIQMQKNEECSRVFVMARQVTH
jgi:hypothetical protein